MAGTITFSSSNLSWRLPSKGPRARIINPSLVMNFINFVEAPLGTKGVMKE
jgi:hypothetical protein